MSPPDSPREPTPDSELTQEPDQHLPGEQAGPYHLLQRVGEGGMGEVWVAEQREPLRRTVAVKLIKVGMDTRQVVARFEVERQALTLMDHPGIAKVLDAGTTAKGRAYFVMEYVRGEPLTTYCDRHRLPIAERLQILTRVCEAVQHAHQKGIIHRDLKPSNVLVTILDGRPVPKIIDFGIAKATAQQLTEATVFTEFGLLIGTPEYMSPEQAEMTALDIDTRTDVYSLGVILYELLAGVLPFDPKALRQAGLDAIRKQIRAVEPPRPSTKVNTEREASTVAARNRHTDPGRLADQIKGDLDWITMKCLEKDRTRRYASASELAADISRHLNDEPVEAHAPSRLYHLRKLIRRNRPTFVAALVVFLALATGLAASLWSLRKADREAARSQHVSQFLQDMLRGIRPSVALGRDTALLREVLDKTAKRLDAGTGVEPEVEADLRNTVGAVYLDLGQYSRAETSFRRAHALRKQVRRSEDASTGEALQNVAVALRLQAKFSDAEAAFREALAIRRKALGSEHTLVAETLKGLGAALAQQGKLKEGEALFREALAIQQERLGVEHADVAKTLNDLGVVLRDEGRLEEAVVMGREALAMHKKVLGAEHPGVAIPLRNLALALQDRGNLQEAESVHREVLAMNRKLLGDEHPSVAEAIMGLATVLQYQGKWAESETLHRDALALKRKLLGPDHVDVGRSLSNLAQVVSADGRQAEAETLFREALDIKRRRLNPAHSSIANTLQSLAAVMALQGKLIEAEGLVREALAIEKKSLGNEHPKAGYAANNLAVVLRREGKLAQAETLHREGAAIQEKALGADNPDVALALADLALTLLLEEKWVEAETAARRCLAIREKAIPDAWETFQARSLAGAALLRQNKCVEAEPLLLGGYDGMKAREGNIPVGERAALANTVRDLVKLYVATGRPKDAAKWRRELEVPSHRRP